MALGNSVVRCENPRRQGHCGAEQDQGETQHEALIASGAPLQPPNRLSAGKAGRLLRLRRPHPSINRLFKSDPIHRLQNAIEPKCHRGRDGTQSRHPGRAASTEVESEVKDKKPGDDHRHANELAEMHSGPAGAAGVYGKHHRMVVGRSAGMQQAHHHIKDEAQYKQHCGEAQRLAVDHETPLRSDLGAFVAQGLYRRGHRDADPRVGAHAQHVCVPLTLTLIPARPQSPTSATATAPGIQASQTLGRCRRRCPAGCRCWSPAKHLSQVTSRSSRKRTGQRDRPLSLI
jgi:hypothetical protein